MSDPTAQEVIADSLLSAPTYHPDSWEGAVAEFVLQALQDAGFEVVRKDEEANADS